MNGSNTAVLAGSMKTVWKILCVARMERKKNFPVCISEI